jgi:rhodanese-related sulfurtransferase
MAETIEVTEAWQMMESGSAVYLDVRSTREFTAGHPRGAYNIPLIEPDAATGRPEVNPGFQQQVEVLREHLAAAGDEPNLIIGCQRGGRSRQACQALEMTGSGGLLDCTGGWGGARNMLGQLLAEGWTGCDLPAATEADSGRDWQSIRALVSGKSA